MKSHLNLAKKCSVYIQQQLKIYHFDGFEVMYYVLKLKYNRGSKKLQKNIYREQR